MSQPEDIGFIGLGHMAQALIAGLLRQKHPASKIWGADLKGATRKKMQKYFRMHVSLSNIEVVRHCSLLVLAVKPQELKTVLQEIRPWVSSQHLIVSIAAGVEIQTIFQCLSQRGTVVRSMPNNPATVGAGVTALFSSTRLSKIQRKRVEHLFQGAGQFIWLKNEALLDGVTGLSGSGPAYVYRFCEALTQAGKKIGLPEKLAYALSLHTLKGAALMLEKTQKTPQELLLAVASKKGTTLAGLHVMSELHFEKLIHQTVKAATRRAHEIRKELKGALCTP